MLMVVLQCGKEGPTIFVLNYVSPPTKWPEPALLYIFQSQAGTHSPLLLTPVSSIDHNTWKVRMRVLRPPREAYRMLCCALGVDAC